MTKKGQELLMLTVTLSLSAKISVCLAQKSVRVKFLTNFMSGYFFHAVHHAKYSLSYSVLDALNKPPNLRFQNTASGNFSIGKIDPFHKIGSNSISARFLFRANVLISADG